MEHIWSVLCSKVLTDKRTNMSSLMDILDAVETPDQIPEVDPQNPIAIGPIPVQLVSFWLRSDVEKPEQAKIRVKLVGPNGQQLGPTQPALTVDLTSNESSYTLVNIAALIYVGFGRYYFEVEKSAQDEETWVRTARLPLLLRSTAKQA